VFFQAVEQLACAKRGGPLRDCRVELLLIRATGLVVAIARILRQLRPFHGDSEPREHRVLIGADHHDALARRVDVRRRDARQDGPAALTHMSELVVLRDQGFHHAEHRLVDGGVHHLAGAGAVPMMQGRERAHAGVHRGQRIANADAHARRRPVGLTDDVTQAAHGLTDAAVTCPLRVRTRLSVARDAHQDEPGIHRRQLVPTATPFLERAGPEVLDYHISFTAQLLEKPLTFCLTKVQRDGLLVAADHRPPDRRRAALLRAPVAHGITLPGCLDLDDFGPHVAQELPAEGSGDERAEFEDAQIGEGAVGRDAVHGGAFCTGGHCGGQGG
jgi:hypothetical protein